MSYIFTNSQGVEPDFSIHLLSDIDETGKQAYYFIKIPKEKLREFYKLAEGAGPFDLSAYGDILYSAYGDTPPEHIRKWIYEEYGFSD
jgi:hypothetical protein